MTTLRNAFAFACLMACVAGAATTPMVTGRNLHALVLKADGTVAGWGSDDSGQLATGRALFSATPTVVPNLPDMQAVSSYSDHVVALDVNGRVWTWGANNSAQLGRRVQRNSSLPGRVQGLAGVTAVAATNAFSVALKSDGTVWVWGVNFGELNATLPVRLEPFQIQGLANVVQISGGLQHVIARKSDGTVMTFGVNGAGVLGDGTFVSSIAAVAVPGITNAIDVNAGTNSSRVVTADGKVWGWGTLSGNYLLTPVPNPREFTGFPSPAVKVLGGLNGFVILANGTVWRFGDGQTPQQVQGLTGIIKGEVARIFDETILGIRADGTLFVSTLNHYGQAGLGHSNPPIGGVAQVPLANVTQVAAGHEVMFAITSDKKLWVWGKDSQGTLGNGAVITYPAPQPIAGIANIVKLAATTAATVALDASGNVWTWGSNDNGGIGSGSRSPSSVPVQVPISGVMDIAGGFEHFVFLKSDGTVWMAGIIPNFFSATPIQLPTSSLPPIRAVAAGWQTIYFITTTNRLFAMGENSSGQVGDGTLVNRTAPVEVTAINEPVLQVAADFRIALAVTASGKVWGWGDARACLLGTNSGLQAAPPQVIPGVSNVVEITAGSHYLARLANGTMMSWGIPNPAAQGHDSPGCAPAPVLEIDSVTSIAATNQGSYAIRSDGTVWGWGPNAIGNALVGDGTLTTRPRPVVVIAEKGAGNLQTNDWFLDARPGVTKTIPPAKIPRAVSLTQSLSSGSLLNVDASIAVRVSDRSKRLGVYVVGLVPPEFLDQVKTVPGALAKAKAAKAGTPILVNLTPAGWTVAAGQLTAFTTGVGNAFLGATNILRNVNPQAFPGARFCIGYGESASDMLSTGSINDFLSLEGAAANALGLPCLLSGVYVDGPRTSQQGDSVPLRAVVVGQGPTGVVRFKERFTDISSDITLAPVNPAVSQASVTHLVTQPGELAFGASYGGDAQNAPATSEVPLRSRVNPMQSTTTTQISGQVSSEIGAEARFVAFVSGNRPGGTVQFMRGGANEGAPVPVVGDQAVRSIVGLGIGDHTLTAVYSGDAGNQASTSPSFAHRVVDLATSTVTLTSSANPVVLGGSLTLTVTVAGTSPAGTITLREDAAAVATAPLSNGIATFSLPGLSPGVHVFSADYAGNGVNTSGTSDSLFQRVSLGSANPPRLANISTRMQVLSGDNVLIGGFIIGGSAAKTVVVRARGPSLTALGVPSALANPVLNLYSGQTVIASNDDWQTASNAAALQSNGFAPSNAQESAIRMTLSPGPYTAIVTGQGGGTGVGLIEVFEVDALTVPLVNIATRGQVLTGDNVMIGGFIIQGTGPQTVVVRARGPSLTALGVPGALANPVLNLYSGQTVIASNDDWQTASNAATLQASGFAPSNAQESAIYITLNPGAYTAIVSGAGGTTGVAIVEVFAVP